MAKASGVSRDRLIDFLTELDQMVTKRHDLFLIGGSAITLGYSPENRTSDIDAVVPGKELEVLGGRDSNLARKYGVYLSPLHDITFSAPKDWKDHCQRQDLSLSLITVYVADPHDIVLGKMARLEPRDFEDIQALFGAGVINADSLLARLNQNLSEIELSEGYRTNAVLLFGEVFGQAIEFVDGTAVLG